MTSAPRTTRFGGADTPDGFVFEMGAGRLALDLANTLDERPRGGIERLGDAARLMRWLAQAGLSAPDAIDDGAWAKHLAEAHALRELIFATALTVTGAARLNAVQLRAWNRWSRRAQRLRRLAAEPAGLAWTEAPAHTPVADALARVAADAIDLFIDPAERSRLRRCAAARCDWLFLDRSRGGNRIWCDMTVCGNRAKAARHHRRRRDV